MHKSNSYVTLTYSTPNLPAGGTLVQRDLQLFLKRVRKARGRFRYYACGEYGDENGRPHFHLCMFGIDWPDKLFYTRNGRGDPLYISAQLTALWGLGHCTIGDVTFESAAYCARYVTKKINGPLADAHYEVVDRYGEVHRKMTERAWMSLKPGISETYFRKYRSEILTHDCVIVRGKEVGIPRYWDVLIERDDPGLFEIIKRNRLRKARLYRKDATPDRLRVREVIALKRFHEQVRSL